MTTHPTPEALAACPFCGGNAQFNEHDDECYFTVLAKAKAAPKGDVSPMVDLIPAWNRRTLSAELAAARAEVDKLHRMGLTDLHIIQTLTADRDAFHKAYTEAMQSLGIAVDERDELQKTCGSLRAEVERLRPKWEPIETAPTSDPIGHNRHRLMLWVKGFGIAFGYAYAIPGEPPYFAVEQHCGDFCVTGWMPLPPPPVAEGV
jgi:hypothetical protein